MGILSARVVSVGGFVHISATLGPPDAVLRAGYLVVAIPARRKGQGALDRATVVHGEAELHQVSKGEGTVPAIIEGEFAAGGPRGQIPAAFQLTPESGQIRALAIVTDRTDLADLIELDAPVEERGATSRSMYRRARGEMKRRIAATTRASRLEMESMHAVVSFAEFSVKCRILL